MQTSNIIEAMAVYGDVFASVFYSLELPRDGGKIQNVLENDTVRT